MTPANHLVFEIVNFELKEIVIGISAAPLEQIRRTHPTLAPSMWQADDHVAYRVVESDLTLEDAAAFALQYSESASLRQFTVFVAGLTSAGFASA